MELTRIGRRSLLVRGLDYRALSMSLNRVCCLGLWCGDVPASEVIAEDLGSPANGIRSLLLMFSMVHNTGAEQH